MKKEIYETLGFLQDASKRRIKPTINDCAQFERNIYNAWLDDKYGQLLDHLSAIKSYIGSQVWPYKGRSGYSPTQITNTLNKTEDLPVILTQDKYDRHEVDYLNFVIEAYSKEILTHSPMHRSTGMFSNLGVLVEIEAKQELIKELKRLVD